jgi:hypothetical protein
MRSAAAPARFGAAVTATVLALAFAVATADAATYTVWSCRGPDGTPVATGAWLPLAGGLAQDGCASGGSLDARIRPAHRTPSTTGGYRFALPAGALIEGYRIHLFAATGGSLHLNAANGGSRRHGLRQAGIDYDGSALDVDAGCLVSRCVHGVPGDPLSTANLLKASGLTSSGLALVVRCGWRHGCRKHRRGSAGAEVRLFRSAVDIVDDHPPVVGPTLGSGASPPATLSATASDPGGGLASVELLVDGSPAARRDAGAPCVEPYVVPAPCPAEMAASFAVDALGLAPGPHTVAFRATDLAGNAVTGESTQLTIGGPPPPAAVLGERIVQVPVTGAPRRVTIRAARKRVSLTGGGARIAGIVTDAAGAPVAGARVRVSARPFGVRRVRPRLETVLATGTDGRFGATVRGRSRLLVLDVDDAEHRAAEAAEVELMQPLSLRVFVSKRGIRNGSSMQLRARVEGAGDGAAGKALLVMTTVRGKWTPIGSLKTDARGEAVWRYRFEGTVIPARYRFRVRLEHAGDVWPWRTIDSQIVIVEVRP